MQLMSKFTSFYKKFQSLSQDHLIIIFGSSSTSLSAHQIHKMLPANPLLDSGISNPSILQVISNSLSENLALFSTNLSSTGKLLNPSTRSVFLSQVAAHHKTTGVVFIVLSINLALIASLSIIVADHLTRTPIYPHNSTSYPTILCLSIHHAWLSGFLIIGSGAHASIFNLRELQPAHFIWAFSLMFLFSGRAYWQELIESILWSHHKLKIIPHIQPRALSISQGRAVGFIHYTLGGIGSTWAFIISRLLVLS